MITLNVAQDAIVIFTGVPILTDRQIGGGLVYVLAHIFATLALDIVESESIEPNLS